MYRVAGKKIIFCGILLIAGLTVYSRVEEPVTIIRQSASPRIQYGIQQVKNAIQKLGYTVNVTEKNVFPAYGTVMVLGEKNSSLVQKAIATWKELPAIATNAAKEGYSITGIRNHIIITGNDPSAVLYGCLEMADRITATQRLPTKINVADQPEMVLRGACIGLQKPWYLPGRTVYEYPYTPETFPWFYDKQLWIQYLDSLVMYRMNALFLWNGHPFASLVKLKEYPYAVEVSDETFKKNEAIYRFITTEADKRGIWVIQMFYNIIVSKPFAEKHTIKTQDRERPIIPLIADYTRKSIAAFVQKYPNVGLMVCLGEAMEGTGNDDVEWFTKTILPGVKDGLTAMGKTEEPPVVLRAHDTDAPSVMKAALPLYKNLYTVAKFNGEALTVARPRGKWADLHRKLSSLGSVHIENVHIMANLEPFRYGSPEFIQQSVKGMHEVMGGNGLHLYPQASYWDWPYSADSIKGKRLLQVERDWIWYKAWSRYAWKADRDRETEKIFWSFVLGARYGCRPEQGKKILDAYEQSGEIAPKLLRRFGITDGNRQTLTLGMLMTQLINPYRYGLFTLMYESESPEGEMLIDYAEKEWKGEKHTGETPVQIIKEVKEHADAAVAAIEAAAGAVTKNREELGRLKNDMYCYRALAYHYAQKAEAALHVLRFKYSNDIHDLEKALPLLEQSIESYRQLVQLTKGTYLYANSMQTQQRKIPIRGVDGTFKTWAEVLLPFENELEQFRHSIDSLKKPQQKSAGVVQLLSNEDAGLDNSFDRFTIDKGALLYSDTNWVIDAYAKEMKGLKGVQLSYQKQLKKGTSLTFVFKKPVKLLVGYFQSAAPFYAKAPELETNAGANDYGQADIKIANALIIKGMPPVNIHSYTFSAGTHILQLPKGVALLLGIIPATQEIPSYDTGLTENGIKKEIDWLFE